LLQLRHAELVSASMAEPLLPRCACFESRPWPLNQVGNYPFRTGNRSPAKAGGHAGQRHLDPGFRRGTRLTCLKGAYADQVQGDEAERIELARSRRPSAPFRG